jgi:hypothetical protein
MTLGELVASVRTDWADRANRTYTPRLTLLIFRLGQYARERPSRLPALVLWRMSDRLYVRLLMGAELPPSIGATAPLKLPHGDGG